MFTDANMGRSTATPVGMTCHSTTAATAAPGALDLASDAGRTPNDGRTWLERDRTPCGLRSIFVRGPRCGPAKPSGLGMVSTSNTPPRAPRKPPDHRSRALMWNMRRRHSSHSWLPPAARTAVKGAPLSSAFIEAKRRPLTATAAEGTAASAAPVADATTKITLHPQHPRFLHDPICNRNGCRRNPFRGGVS